MEWLHRAMLTQGAFAGNILRLLVAGAMCVSPVIAGAGDAPQRMEASPWAIAGGQASIRWNRELLDELGIAVVTSGDANHRAGADASTLADALGFALNPHEALTLSLRSGAQLERFGTGRLVADSGFQLSLGWRAIDLESFSLLAGDGADPVLVLVDASGNEWFRLIRPMYDISSNRRNIDFSTMDITLGRALAKMIGRPETAGWTIADFSLRSSAAALPAPAAPAATYRWPGDPAPAGGVYRVDLLMKHTQFQYSRCDGCSGPLGNGRVVFTPSATLRNNINAGFEAYTVDNDPLGASRERWAAGVAWYPKFSPPFAPYQNDQHPYLTWNMYRVNADGSFQQIGRSGIKHAYITNNIGCLDADDHSAHVLGRGCEDTYTVSHNDNPNALSPRHEVIAATGQWGRCGSVYDPGCSGVGGASGYGSFDQRLVVSEADISSAVHPAASWLFEAWYVTRDDTNVYNSMATVRTLPAHPTGWNVNNQTGYRLGPAIDRWVDPNTPAQGSMSRELVAPEGRVKVAVKARQLTSSDWRYDYAIANIDFARAVTDGSEPNLRVLSNDGFDEIVIPIPATGASNFVVRDGDSDGGNDWSVSQSSGSLRIRAAGSSERLNWGSLHSISFTARGSPMPTAVQLHVAQPGSPSSYHVQTLGPAASDRLFDHGFDQP